MNKLLITSFLAVFAFGQGCIINQYGGGGDGRDPGDITFFWTFQGEMCDAVPQVANVRVTIPGESLDNDGVYGCLNGEYAGITLHDFVGGNYEYVLEGLSNTGATLYRASGTFSIDGDTRLDVDLTPVGQQTSFAYLSWAFPANWAGGAPSCADATITYIDIEFDDSGDWIRYDCEDGRTNGGAQSPLLAPGVHKIELVGVYVEGQNEYAIAYKEGSITTQAHQPTNHSFTLAWEIGGTTIAWQLKDGSTNQTCAVAEVETVFVHFRNVETGEYVYGDVGDDNPCTASTVTYRYLSPGTYEVYISAENADNVMYLSPDADAPRVTVSAGVWTPDTPAVVTVNTFRE